jgi:hypothetical protein
MGSNGLIEGEGCVYVLVATLTDDGRETEKKPKRVNDGRYVGKSFEFENGG